MSVLFSLSLRKIYKNVSDLLPRARFLLLWTYISKFYDESRASKEQRYKKSLVMNFYVAVIFKWFHAISMFKHDGIYKIGIGH